MANRHPWPIPPATTLSPADTDPGIAGLKLRGPALPASGITDARIGEALAVPVATELPSHASCPQDLDDSDRAATANGGNIPRKLMNTLRKPTGCGIDDTVCPLPTSAE
jgi:hypothetical protein